MQLLNKVSGFAHWLPRLSLAAIFLYHGLPKFSSAQGMSDSMGLPLFLVYLIALGEVGGALLILWGGFGPDWTTRLAGFSFAVIMLGAIFMVHWQHGWNSIGNMGMEFQVLIFAVSVYFLLKGKGANQGAGSPPHSEP
jgi:putative oxidoreductase